MKKEIIQFRQVVPAGQTITLTERLKADGAIVQIRARFYSGQQRSLQVHPYVLHKNNVIEDVFTYVGESTLSGDDDYFTFDVQVQTELDDFLAVTFTNLDVAYDYTGTIYFVVQYEWEG